MATKRVNVKAVETVLSELKNRKVTDKLIDDIIAKLAAGISTQQPKTIIDDEGNELVWCNYHNEYEPADRFKTKSNGKYKSNCEEGEKAVRKYRAQNRKIGDILLKLYRLGKMTPELEEQTLATEYSDNILDRFPEDLRTDVANLLTK